MGFDPTTVVQVLILAIVQGVAEFLPISSSGHLLVLGKFFELPEVLTLSIILHGGTLLSVLFFFAKEIIEACTSKPRVLGLVIVGSIPTVIIAFGIMTFVPELEESLLLTGFLFIVTGILLMTILRSRCQLTESERYYEQIELAADDDGDDPDYKEPKTADTTTWLDAIVVGIAQGFAALPGLSRSGTTISTGVGLNFDREWAAKYSFLLSIPIIAGGAALEILKIFKNAEGEGLSDKLFSDPFLIVYLGGAAVSFLVGWFSLACLMRMLRDGKLHYFAYWLFIIGPSCIGYWCWENWELISSRLGLGASVSAIMSALGLA